METIRENDIYIPQALNIERLRDIVTSNMNVVVLSYSDWCPFCLEMKTIFRRINSNDNSICFFWLQVDEEKEISHILSINSLPTVSFISSSKQVAQISGLISEERLSQAVDEFKKYIEIQEIDMQRTKTIFPMEL